jgi:hypothetical protein
MDSYRKIEFKTRLFEGYNVWLDIEKYKQRDDFDDLVKDVRIHLVNFLKTFNLKVLEDRAKSIELKVEMFCNSNDILKKTSGKDTIYICERTV